MFLFQFKQASFDRILKNLIQICSQFFLSLLFLQEVVRIKVTKVSVTHRSYHAQCHMDTNIFTNPPTCLSIKLIFFTKTDKILFYFNHSVQYFMISLLYPKSLKSVRIRSYSGPYFPAFGLQTERCGVSLRIQSKCEKIQTRIKPNVKRALPQMFDRVMNKPPLLILLKVFTAVFIKKKQFVCFFASG